MISEPRLVSDIGGTNARFAIAENGKVNQATCQTYKVADFPTFEDCLRTYLNTLSDNSSSIAKACISVAGPVSDNSIDFTNNHWRIDANKIGVVTGFDFTLINDFESMAYACFTLGTNDVASIGDLEIENPVAGSRLSVLGAGTGLGVANGFWSTSGFHPLPGEGGHVAISPINELQHKIVEQIRIDLGLERVSAERILSGPGLLNLYRAMCAIEQRQVRFDTPADITQFATAPTDVFERQVLEQFCVFLGTIAGDLALTFAPQHGVFLAGGVTEAISNVLPSSGFRKAFEAKGRLSHFVQSIPTFIITADEPGLIGAAVATI